MSIKGSFRGRSIVLPDYGSTVFIIEPKLEPWVIGKAYPVIAAKSQDYNIIVVLEVKSVQEMRPAEIGDEVLGLLGYKDRKEFLTYWLKTHHNDTDSLRFDCHVIEAVVGRSNCKD